MSIIRKYTRKLAIVSAASFATASVIFANGGAQAANTPSSYEVAQVAGAWTQCVAWNSGTTYNIVYGNSEPRCFALARRCTNNPNVQVTFYYTPVIVPAPYTECSLQ